MSQERACAVAVRLLDLGYFRIGNDVYTDTNGSFGLTTMLREHVTKRGGRLTFCFVGKSGVEHCIEIDDEATIAALDVMRARGAAATGCWRGRTGAVARPRRRSGQQLRPGGDRDRGHGQGLPDLARHRHRGGRTGEHRRAGSDQGLTQAGRLGDDEGGLGVPGQHPHARPHGLRRPARGRGLRARRTITVKSSYDTDDARQAALERAVLRLLKDA